MIDWRYGLVSIAIYGGLSALVLVRSSMRPKERMVAAWAEAHGLDLPGPERELVSGWLRRSRLWRAIGFVLPFLFVGLGSTYWGLIHPERPQPLPLSLGWWLVPAGYLVGVVAAEVTWRRPVATAAASAPSGDQAESPAPGPAPGQEHVARAAALIPRDLRDYLPVWLPRTTAAVTLAVVLLGILIALQPASAFTAGWTREPGTAAINAAIALAVAGLGTLLTRWLVARRQPLTPGFRLELDDALRATSVHATAAACLAFTLLILSRQLDLVGGAGNSLVGWAALLANFACLGAAIGCLVDLAQRHRWTVRRGTQARTGV